MWPLKKVLFATLLASLVFFSFFPAWSKELPAYPGKLVFTSNEADPSFDIYIMNPDGTGKINLSDDYGVISLEPSLSPDGHRVVWYGGPGGDAAIMTCFPDGSYRQLIITGGDAVSPDISPGFPLLAYVLVGGEELMICRLDGTFKERLTDGSWPDWSPDGSKIAFARWQSGAGICVYDLSNGTEDQLTQDDDRLPQWSPDGTEILFVRPDANGDPHIWIMDADVHNPSQMTSGTGESSPSWSPDGLNIAYINEGDIWIMEANGDNPENITKTPWVESEVDWGPDAGPCGFTLAENFDAYPGGTSVSAVPGWNSLDGSANYDTDAVILTGVPTTTEPNHFRLVGYPNILTWAIMEINSPYPVTGLTLKFDYERQPNSHGKVEISSSPEGGWIDLNLPFVNNDDNVISDTMQVDLTGFLTAAGVGHDVYIRWSNYASVTNSCVFMVDSVEATVTAAPAALRYESPSAGPSGCEPGISMHGDAMVGGSFSMHLSGAVKGTIGYLLAGIDTSRASVPYSGATLLLSPVSQKFPVMIPIGSGDAFDGFFDSPLSIPNNQNLEGLKLNFQYFLLDPGSTGISLYSTAGLEVFVQ